MPINLIAAVHTPFDSLGNLNLLTVEVQAAHLAQSGVSGVFLCGSTGEGMSLTVGERKEIAEAWSAIAPSFGMNVVVQVGSNCQCDAIELAEHAASLNVNMISAHAPSYFLPKSVEDLIHFFLPIAKAASGLPFYFYDIPELTGVRLPTARFLKSGRDIMPSLAGVKYTSSDLAQLQECIRLDSGQFDVWFGSDEAMLAAYALGVQGAVGSTFNFLAPLYHRIASAFDAGDHARARHLQAKSILTVNVLSKFGYHAAAKSLMSWYGVDCGPVRAPLRPLCKGEQVELFKQISSIGFPFEQDVVADSSLRQIDNRVVRVGE